MLKKECFIKKLFFCLPLEKLNLLCGGWWFIFYHFYMRPVTYGKCRMTNGTVQNVINKCSYAAWISIFGNVRHLNATFHFEYTFLCQKFPYETLIQVIIIWTKCYFLPYESFCSLQRQLTLFSFLDAYHSAEWNMRSREKNKKIFLGSEKFLGRWLNLILTQLFSGKRINRNSTNLPW